MTVSRGRYDLIHTTTALFLILILNFIDMVAIVIFLVILFGGVKLLAIANNIGTNEAMDKYSGKVFVVAIIIFIILMSIVGSNDDVFN